MPPCPDATRPAALPRATPPIATEPPRARRSGFGVGRRAADIVSDRRALMGGSAPRATAAPGRPDAACDDLVERMAEALTRAARYDALDLDDASACGRALIAAGFAALDAGRLVGQAAPRARARQRSAARLDHAGTGAAFGSLALACTAASSLLCTPARAAAGPLLTDERLSGLMICAPLLIGALVLLVLCWADRGRPARIGEEAEPAYAPDPSPERRIRDAERG